MFNTEAVNLITRSVCRPTILSVRKAILKKVHTAPIPIKIRHEKQLVLQTPSKPNSTKICAVGPEI